MKEFKLLREEQEPYHFDDDEIHHLKHALRSLNADIDPYIDELEIATTGFLGLKVARDNTPIPTPAELRKHLRSIATRAQRLAKDIDSLEPYIEYHSLARAIALFSDANAYIFIDDSIAHLQGMSDAINKYTDLKPGDYSKCLGYDIDKIMELMKQTVKVHPESGLITGQEFGCFAIEQEIARITPKRGSPVKSIEEDYIRNIGRRYEKHFKVKPAPSLGSIFYNHIIVVFDSLKNRGHKLPANPDRLIKRALADLLSLT